MPLKVSTWNVEHSARLIRDNPPPDVMERSRRVRQTIEEVDPDILCMVEGPRGERAVRDFAHRVLNEQWVPVFLDPQANLGDRDGDYRTRGTQWIWFLVRPALAGRCRLQSPETWQAFTGASRWPVHLWGQVGTYRHSHYRHPQVLIFETDGGAEVEVIGVHLKSKINRETIVRDADGNLTGAYLHEALEARVKLATEARDVRRYIGAKFEQLAAPGIIVLGDCNDGPGHDYFETNYLFFDLVGNLQGEVLVAEKFFNHALFDFPAHLRWTARYRNALTGTPASQNPLLLDHVLMSQPLCRGSLPLVVNAGAGCVEHEAYERANAGSSSRTRSSDHRPVSVNLDDTA